MLKNKRILFSFMVAIVLFFIPNICNATVEYTRNFPGNDGTIELNLTGLDLSDEKQYEFSLVSKGGTPENWFLITDYTDTTAKVVLSSGTQKIIEVLRQTNNGQLFIREKDNTSEYVLERLNVDLTLPYLQSLAYTKQTTGHYDLTGNLLYGKIGNNYIYSGDNHTFTQFEKVTDSSLITKFLNIKNNNGDLFSLEGSLPQAPTTGYSTDRAPQYSNKKDGLYLLWVKRTGENCKEVYSCIIHDGMPEATNVTQYLESADVERPKVTSISVSSPTSGTYTTGQTIKIRVLFTENITGTQVPTLTIKFGESEERQVTNGTLMTGITGKGIIEYSYNIQEGDNGQLATVSLIGGTIVDEEGNAAELSCPIISGYTIKANTEPVINNQTENLDQENHDENTPDTGTSDIIIEENKSNQESNQQEENGTTGSAEKETKVEEKQTKTQSELADDTQKKDTKLPQTGASILAFAFIGIIAFAVISKVKYGSYKDI